MAQIKPNVAQDGNYHLIISEDNSKYKKMQQQMAKIRKQFAAFEGQSKIRIQQFNKYRKSTEKFKVKTTQIENGLRDKIKKLKKKLQKVKEMKLKPGSHYLSTPGPSFSFKD